MESLQFGDFLLMVGFLASSSISFLLGCLKGGNGTVKILHKQTQESSSTFAKDRRVGSQKSSHSSKLIHQSSIQKH